MKNWEGGQTTLFGGRVQRGVTVKGTVLRNTCRTTEGTENTETTAGFSAFCKNVLNVVLCDLCVLCGFETALKWSTA
jgi:hypothetical protein